MLNSGLAYKNTPSLHHSIIDSESSYGDLWIYFRLRITSNTFFLAARQKHENKLIPFILIPAISAVTIINNIITPAVCSDCVFVCVCVLMRTLIDRLTDWLLFGRLGPAVRITQGCLIMHCVCQRWLHEGMPNLSPRPGPRSRRRAWRIQAGTGRSAQGHTALRPPSSPTLFVTLMSVYKMLNHVIVF